MIADLCRLYHYTIDHVLSMPLNRAGFLWGRGVAAERMQAYRIAAAMNGVDIDKKREDDRERRREFREGRPSEQGKAIMDALMRGET